MTAPQPPKIAAALETLAKLRAAAPPVAAQRLAEVMDVLAQLQAANATLSAQVGGPTTPAFPLSPTVESPEDCDSQFQTRLAEQPSALAADSPGVASALAELTEEERAALITYLQEGARRPRPAVSSHLLPDSAAENDAAPASATGALDAIPPDEELLLLAGENLRPPLIGLRGQAESLLAGKAGRVTGELAAALQHMQDSADGALALIDSLATLRLIRDDQLEIRYSVFAPGALVRAASAQFERQAAAHDNILTLVVEETLPEVYADFAAALVILSDLLDNAIRYTPPGGATRLSAEPLGAHVLFTVADTGIGLTDEDAAQIGRAFWRATHQPLVRQHTGTGLRLFLARKVLALLGGELFSSGDPGLGSSFSFTLPVAI